MTSPTRVCACGCGAPVANKWVRGHSARGEDGFRTTGPDPLPRLEPIPGPDDPVWDDDTVDVGELVPDDVSHDAPTSHAAEPAVEPPLREAGPAAPHPP